MLLLFIDLLYIQTDFDSFVCQNFFLEIMLLVQLEKIYYLWGAAIFCIFSSCVSSEKKIATVNNSKDDFKRTKVAYCFVAENHIMFNLQVTSGFSSAFMLIINFACFISPASIYLLKVINRRRSDVVIVKFEQISHHFLVFLLVALNK